MVSCVGAARGKLQRSGRRVLVCGGVCQPLVRTHRCAPPSEDGGGGGGAAEVRCSWQSSQAVLTPRGWSTGLCSSCCLSLAC